jgi:hypothetical protein
LLCSQQLNAARTPTTRARKSARKLARNNPRPNPNWAGAKASTAAEALQKFFTLTRPNPNWAGAKATHSSGSAAEFYFLFDQTQTGQAKPFNPKQQHSCNSRS